MRDSDEAVERVLAGLRDAEAPEGLERRMMAAVEERSARRSERWSLRLMGAGPLMGGRQARLAVAGGLVLMLGFGWTAFRGNRAEHKVALRREAPVRGSIEAEGGTNATEGRRTWNALDGDVKAVLRGEETVGSEARRAKRSHETTPGQEVKVASFPAPEAPLTAEERLLLRVAHRSSPKILAALKPVLNPDLRAARDERDEKEFESFFAVPPPLPQPAAAAETQ